MKKRPHTLLFNPGQWRSDVMGHLGNPAALTPNLDRFVATEGVSFRNAFCQNTACTPSRCSFMTGWYPHVRGHRTMFHMRHPEWQDPDEVQNVVREAEYASILAELKERLLTWYMGTCDAVPRKTDRR